MTTIKLRCEYCKDEFETTKATLGNSRRFCGKNCANAFRRGKPSWNTGLAWSEEHRKKLSRVHLGGNNGYSLLQNIARKKGWTILDREQNYNNNKSKLQCKCAEEHNFSICLSKALGGQGCRICSQGISERTCRWYFEHIFGEKFPSVRPHWLIGPKGFALELDGYCEKLNLAFEFQGRQHYTENKFFNSRQSFKERKTYDALKRQICSQRKITLIEIPDMQNPERLDTTILEKCIMAGVSIPEIDWYNPLEMDVNKPDKLKEYQEIAISQGGKCLSTKYVNNHTKLEFQCNVGHAWQAIPCSVKRGCWCRICAGLSKGTIEEMQRIAISRLGICLSKKYINSQTNLLWQCAEKHEWSATPANIKRKKWCPHCAKKHIWEKRRFREVTESTGRKNLTGRYEKTCQFCSTSFYVHYARIDTAKYCSIKCYFSSLQNTEGAEKIKRTCVTCGKELKHRSTYCSLPCRDVKVRGTIKCKICGKEISIIRSQLAQRKTCSQECRYLALSRQMKGKMPKNIQLLHEYTERKKNRLTTTCHHCGKQFQEMPHRLLDGRGKYCNKTCMLAHQRKHFKKSLNVPAIIADYTVGNKSAAAISTEYGCDCKRIYALLRRNNVRIRKGGPFRKDF